MVKRASSSSSPSQPPRTPIKWLQGSFQQRKSLWIPATRAVGGCGKLDCATSIPEEFQEAVKQKAQLEAALRSFKVLRSMSPQDPEALTKRDDLVAILRKHQFEESILMAFPVALTKAPESRGPFAWMAINQLEADIGRRIAEQEDNDLMTDKGPAILDPITEKSPITEQSKEDNDLMTDTGPAIRETITEKGPITVTYNFLTDKGPAIRDPITEKGPITEQSETVIQSPVDSSFTSQQVRLSVKLFELDFPSDLVEDAITHCNTLQSAIAYCKTQTSMGVLLQPMEADEAARWWRRAAKRLAVYRCSTKSTIKVLI